MTENDSNYIKVGNFFEIFTINSENWFKNITLDFYPISANFTSHLQTVHVIKPVDEFLLRKLQVTHISIFFDFMLSNSKIHAFLMFLVYLKGTM